MVKDAGLKILRAKPYMDRRRYYFFSVLDWLWNRRSPPDGVRWGDRLEPFLERKEWVQRRLHSWLKGLMQSKRSYGPGAAGLVLLACKARTIAPKDPNPPGL